MKLQNLQYARQHRSEHLMPRCRIFPSYELFEPGALIRLKQNLRCVNLDASPVYNYLAEFHRPRPHLNGFHLWLDIWEISLSPGTLDLLLSQYTLYFATMFLRQIDPEHHRPDTI